MVEDKPTFFIDVEKSPRFSQMEGLETTVLTGLEDERMMMMVLNAILPGHTVPVHSHPHEQIGVVYRGAPSESGTKRGMLRRGISTVYLRIFPMGTQLWAMNPS